MLSTSIFQFRGCENLTRGTVSAQVIAEGIGIAPPYQRQTGPDGARRASQRQPGQPGKNFRYFSRARKSLRVRCPALGVLKIDLPLPYPALYAASLAAIARKKARTWRASTTNYNNYSI